MMNPAPMPVDEIEAQELRRIVLDSINTLPEKHRLVVTLHYMDGLSTKEIGEFLEIPAGTVESRLHRAKMQLRENTALIESALSQQKLGAEFAQKLMNEADRLSHESQEYRHAIQIYQRVAENWPDSEYASTAKTLIGINYVRLGELDRAIDVYEEALSEELHEDMACRYYLGKAYQERQDYARALTQYRVIVEHHRKRDGTLQEMEKLEWQFQRAWHNSAVCCEKLGKFKAARAVYGGFLQQFSSGELAICARGALKRLANQKDLSDDELQEIQKLLERAFYFFQRKIYPMAMEACQSVIHRSPAIIYAAEAQTMMGEIYQQMGETKKAIETFKKELAHYSQIGSRSRLAQAYEAYGDVTYALEDYSRALAEYQIIIRNYPDARPSDLRQAWHSSGNCYKKLGRLDEAKAAYNSAIEIKGDDNMV